MSVILSTLRDLARTLGCANHQTETVVREERSARAAMSRRGLFKAAGAVAAGLLVSVPSPTPMRWGLLSATRTFTINGFDVTMGDLAWVNFQDKPQLNGLWVLQASGTWERR